MFPTLIDLQNTTCSDYSNCHDCSNSNIDCYWCTSESTCSTENGYCSTELTQACDNSIYTIILIIVVLSMVCICCSTCYLRRVYFVHNDHALQSFLARLLPEQARRYIFRNSLLGEGENEWMCIICGFDNKPRNADCIMCGTAHTFSTEYKDQKLQEKTLRRKDDRAKLRAAQNNGNEHGSGRTTKLNNNQYISVTQDEKEDQPLLNHLSKAVSTNVDDVSKLSISLGLDHVSLVANSPRKKQTQHPLSPQQLSQAINMRRYNQLSLRQKSARRRKMWQRKYDPVTGEIIWLRVPIKNITVGKGKFGYTPRNSITESRSYSFASSNNSYLLDYHSMYGSNSERNSLREPFRSDMIMPQNVYESLLSTQKENDVEREHNNADSDTRNPVIKDLLDALHNNTTVPSGTPSKSSSFRFHHSNGVKTPTRRRKFSQDSFGDSVIVSSSPGFISVYDATTKQFTWQKIEARHKLPSSTRDIGTSSAPVTTISPLAHIDGDDIESNQTQIDRGNQISSEENCAYTTMLAQYDLESIAALTFKDKHEWFLERLQELQQPAKEGYLKIEVRRSAIFHDSYRAFQQIDQNNIYKYIRFQFHQEVGVDAGGLEREWFYLMTQEIFHPKHQLFVATNQNSLLGYYINPVVKEYYEQKKEYVYGGGENRRNQVTINLVDSNNSLSEFPPSKPNAASELDAVNHNTSTGSSTANANSEAPSKNVLEIDTTSSNGPPIVTKAEKQLRHNYLNGINLENYNQYYHFVGRFLGKAILEQQTISAFLSVILRKQILNMPITFSDLEFVDEELYQHLKSLLSMKRVDDLMLDFTISYPLPRLIPHTGVVSPDGQSPSQILEFELIPNGANTYVTDANKLHYLQLQLKHRLFDSVKEPLVALLEGFYEIIPPHLISVFDYQELELLLCGMPEINVEDWKRHTEYLGEYSMHGAKHPVIQWFWEAVETMSNEERIKLFQFTTGSCRVPIQGFKSLQSHDGKLRLFNIQSIFKEVSVKNRMI